MRLELLSAFVLLWLLQGCERDSQRRLKPAISMGDSGAAPQLVSGFYGVEGNSWRWTARQFVILFPGARDAHKSHSLKLNVFVPEGQINQLGPLTLTASVDGMPLSQETFSAPGVHTYMRIIPNAALKSNIVPITFWLDKAVPPVSADGRELGLVVNNAQLTAN